MIDRILNGLGDSSSSRSGAATTYSISTPSGTYTGLTKEQYDAWKAAVDHYTNAYGIAYSYDLTAPNWSEFTMTNGQSIVDSYVQKALNSGKKSKSESWQTFVETRAAQLAPQTQAQPKGFKEILIGEEIVNVPISEYDARKAQYQEAAKLSVGYGIELSPEMIKQIYLGYGADILSSMQQKAEKAANDWLIAASKDGNKPNINIPEPTNVQTLPSNGGEKKGSGLLFPGLILAAGIVAAILLTKKSRR